MRYRQNTKGDILYGPPVIQLLWLRVTYIHCTPNKYMLWPELEFNPFKNSSIRKWNSNFF